MILSYVKVINRSNSPFYYRFWVQPLYNNEDRKKLAVIESALGSSAKPFTDKTPKADDYVSVKLNER